MSTPDKPFDVFISHSTQDAQAAAAIKQHLQASGLKLPCQMLAALRPLAMGGDPLCAFEDGGLLGCHAGLALQQVGDVQVVLQQ